MWRRNGDSMYYDEDVAGKLDKFAVGGSWEFLPHKTRHRVVSQFEDNGDAFIVFRAGIWTTCINVDDLNEDDWQWVMPELPARAGDRVKASGANSQWRTVVAIWNDGDGFAMVTDWDTREMIRFSPGSIDWTFSPAPTLAE